MVIQLDQRHYLLHILLFNWKHVEILQLRAKFQTAVVSCSRFIRITNSSDHRRIWTTNLLHTKSSLNPLGHMAWHQTIRDDFVWRRFAVQTLLWLLEFVILINLEPTPSQFKTCWVKCSLIRKVKNIWDALRDFPKCKSCSLIKSNTPP